MCKLRCVTLKFVVDGRPQMRSFVVNNDLQKRNETIIFAHCWSGKFGNFNFVKCNLRKKSRLLFCIWRYISALQQRFRKRCSGVP